MADKLIASSSLLAMTHQLVNQDLPVSYSAYNSGILAREKHLEAGDGHGLIGQLLMGWFSGCHMVGKECRLSPRLAVRSAFLLLPAGRIPPMLSGT